MDELIKKDWIDALRSNKYSQTKSWLKTGQGFCCLGVLTDIYVQRFSKSWDEFDSLTILPVEVVNWAGLDDVDPDVDLSEDELKSLETKVSHTEAISITEDYIYFLSHLNDFGLSFEDIADIIETKL